MSNKYVSAFLIGEKSEGNFIDLDYCAYFHGLRFTKSTSMTQVSQWVICDWIAEIVSSVPFTNLNDVGIYNVQERPYLHKDSNDT